MQIESITLLSVNEASALPKEILDCGHYYWLRSPGSDSSSAAFVDYGGYVLNFGYYVINYNYGVRPALVIPNLDSLNLRDFEEITMWDTKWIYIGKNMLFAKDIICERRFDENSNVFEKSEIKEYLDNWLKEHLEN